MQNGLPIQLMYNKIFHATAFGHEEYKVSKRYEDPLRLIKQRQFLKINKGSKNSKYVTKRGSFLTQQISLTKDNPSPGQYEHLDQWPKKTKSLIKYPDRKTFVHSLMEKARKQKLPAPGQYKTFKSLKQLDQQNKLSRQKQKKTQNMSKTNFIDDSQVAGSIVPGPGNYNPRQVRSLIIKRKTKPQDWIKKSITDQQKTGPKSPNFYSYTPLPSDYKVFASMQKHNQSRQSVWGKQVRFDFESKSKRAKTLGPGHYDMIHFWKGKNDKRRVRDHLQATTQLFSKSLYY